jgi:hypothetical protein
MQAGLKCDRVPTNAPQGRSIPTHLDPGLAGKSPALQ